MGLRGCLAQREIPVPVSYKGHCFGSAFRLDMLVEQKVIVELKVVEVVMPVHEAQLLSYLRLTGLRLGLLINFNVPLLKRGLRRVVNNL